VQFFKIRKFLIAKSIVPTSFIRSNIQQH